MTEVTPFFSSLITENNFKKFCIPKYKQDITFFSCKAVHNMQKCAHIRYDYSPIFNWILRGY